MAMIKHLESGRILDGDVYKIYAELRVLLDTTEIMPESEFEYNEKIVTAEKLRFFFGSILYIQMNAELDN